MNIFVLATLAVEAAALHNDVHVNKMVTESTQLLYMVLRRWRVPLPLHRKLGIVDAPVGQRKHIDTLWASACVPHFEWLLALALALAERYAEIFGREHACFKHLRCIRLHLLFARYPAHVPRRAVRPSEFMDQLRADPTLSDDIRTHVAMRIAKQNPPHGCQFGVVALGLDKLPSVFTIADILVAADNALINHYDAVATYRRYYAMKLEFAKRTNDQRYGRRLDNVPLVFAPLRRAVRALATDRGHVCAPASTPAAARTPKRKRDAQT